MSGCLIAFEGLDQSGKQTQAAALRDYVVADGHPCELLSFPDAPGVIRFGPLRVLLMDTAAMGLLRKELIDDLGGSAARILLSRFGFAHGWRTAESLRRDFPWDSVEEWRQAGSVLHTLLGHVVADEVKRRFRLDTWITR